MREDPLARHNVDARRLRNETPCPIVDEHLLLVSHGCPPVSFGQGAAVVRRNRRQM
jgi:hypothetical protein